MLILTPGKVTLAELERIYWEELPVKLHGSCHPAMAAAQAKIAAAASGNAACHPGNDSGAAHLAGHHRGALCM